MAMGYIDETDDYAGGESHDTLLEKHPDERPIQRSHRKRIIYISLTILILAIAALATRQIWRLTSPNAQRFEDCGGSPEEARRRGCHLDVLSFAWQTPECYDHENSEAFRTHNGTWTYFTSPGSLEQKTEEEALSGENTTFVTALYHWTHCTYMWRQLHRAYAVRGYIDSHLDNFNHTLHCQHVILNIPDPDELLKVNTIGRVIYPRCRRIW